MNLSAENDALERIRRAVLEVLPEAWAVYVFGSVARGDPGPSSDLDLAVLLPPGESGSSLWLKAQDVTERLGRDVDLVDLRLAGDVLRMQVLRHGRPVHVAQPGEVLAWEAQAMTRYGHYRREVAGLMEQFDRTGIAYATAPS
ncbi:MAG: nucleotidyltransferase domain-containing protein [Wenzhouxiangellaceae bacterium]|nr:nucleotidyltransferase domain-containing protein [Wenzhouxiangellaceae bacterium]